MPGRASIALVVAFTISSGGCGGRAVHSEPPGTPPATAASVEAAPPAQPLPASSSTPAPEPASTKPAGAPSAGPSAPRGEPSGNRPDPAEAIDFEAEQASFAARASGPATGGPRGARPCEFRESVDTYRRQCLAQVNADGSVSVTAKGTKLNPSSGFAFTLHGAENQWIAQGTLNAFAHCAGPFAAPVTAVIDQGVKTYEIRFKQHCMIVVR